MKRTMMTAFLLAAVTAASPAAAQPTKAQPSTPASLSAQPAKKGKLVFAAMTGMEDMQTMSSAYRHAMVALKSGHLDKVVVLSYGRSAVVYDSTVKAIPDDVRKLAAQAQAAGVELVVCKNSLEKLGIDPASLQPKPRIVENAMAELARLVAEGYAVVSY